MASLSGSFTTDGSVSPLIIVRAGGKFSYSFANSFTGQCVVQKQGVGGFFYTTLLSHTAVVSSTTVHNDSTKEWKIRLKCVDLSDGVDSIDWTLADVAAPIYEIFSKDGRRLFYVTDDLVFNVDDLLIAGLPIAGTGDVVGPSASVDSEFCIYNSTTGKLVKRASGTGYAKGTAGVASFQAVPIPVADGGTNSTTALSNNRVIRSSGGVIGEAAAITASRALVSDANGIPTHATTTTTELNYVNGVTSAIQTQLSAKAANYAETDDGNSSTADTIDWSVGCAHKSTLTGNVTYTFTAPSQAGTPLVLRVLTGAGSFTATWPATVKWSGGTGPTITTTASRMDLISFYWDGTNYYGSFSQNYTP